MHSVSIFFYKQDMSVLHGILATVVTRYGKCRTYTMFTDSFEILTQWVQFEKLKLIKKSYRWIISSEWNKFTASLLVPNYISYNALN